jgi:hypothetical protein
MMYTKFMIIAITKFVMYLCPSVCYGICDLFCFCFVLFPCPLVLMRLLSDLILSDLIIMTCLGYFVHVCDLCLLRRIMYIQYLCS